MSDYITPPHQHRQGSNALATKRIIRNLIKQSLDEIGLEMYQVDHAAVLGTGMMLWDVKIRDNGEQFGDVSAGIDGAFAEDVRVREITWAGFYYHACLIVDVVKALAADLPQEARLI